MEYICAGCEETIDSKLGERGIVIHFDKSLKYLHLNPIELDTLPGPYDFLEEKLDSSTCAGKYCEKIGYTEIIVSRVPSGEDIGERVDKIRTRFRKVAEISEQVDKENPEMDWFEKYCIIQDKLKEMDE